MEMKTITDNLATPSIVVTIHFYKTFNGDRQ